MAAARIQPRKTSKTKRAILTEQVEKAGPSRARLRKLAKKNRPPQAWYDAVDDPFSP